MGVYLHVPFCLRKCPYCSFFSIAGSTAAQHELFVRGVEGHIRRIVDSGRTEGRQVETIFVGGGTPSVLEPAVLIRLLEQIRCSFPLAAEELETSVEVNPATVTRTDLARLNAGGVNRVSIGIQSFNDRELLEIGRPHTAAESLQTISDARAAGFSRLNIDLMYGLPGQTVSAWERNLQKALEQEPEHLAIYELTLEEGTPFALRRQKGEINLPGEDEVLEMMELTRETVAGAGFSRYEISNYARPGRECRHNLNYWHNGWYAGLGPGAVSFLAGCRYTAVEDIDAYCQRIDTGRKWWSYRERLDPEAGFRETVVMGLRMTQGVSISGLGRRFGIDARDYYGEILQRLEQQGLVVLSGDRLHLSLTGMNLANQVMAQLV